MTSHLERSFYEDCPYFCRYAWAKRIKVYSFFVWFGLVLFPLGWTRNVIVSSYSPKHMHFTKTNKQTPTTTTKKEIHKTSPTNCQQNQANKQNSPPVSSLRLLHGLDFTISKEKYWKCRRNILSANLSRFLYLPFSLSRKGHGVMQPL